MTNFETLLFDLDGTLIDSGADLANAVNLLRVELELESLPRDLVLSYVGDGATQLLQRALGPELFSAGLLQRFLEIYDDHLQDETLVYEGIEDFLVENRDKKLAVVTNKPLGLALKVIEGLGLSPFFDVVIGPENCIEKKPHPAPVLLALEKLGSTPETAVMIGDHHVDLRSGRQAGVKTCFCAYGIGNHDNVPYDFLAENPSDLPRLFSGERG